MAALAFIRGWINATDDDSEQIRNLIDAAINGSDLIGEDDRFRDSLKHCWHFPTANGPAEDFVLVGATVRQGLLPLFEAILSSVAREIVEHDASNIYTLAGRLEVTIEGESENQEWIIADGCLDTSRRVPYLLSP